MKRILIVDDHVVVGKSIALLLKHAEKDTEADAVGTMQEAMKLLEQEQSYDLVLLDFDMPGINGLDGLQLLKQNYPDLTVGIISGITDVLAIKAAISKGAIGWLPKTLDDIPLIHAINTMIAGGSFIPADAVLDYVELREKWSGFTQKEIEVANLISDGHSDKAISNQLGISPKTTQNHVRAILKKAGVDNRTKFAAKFREYEN
ncbi:MAG: response regulator transcription factor [Lentilitoribacter sp.]